MRTTSLLLLAASAVPPTDAAGGAVPPRSETAGDGIIFSTPNNGRKHERRALKSQKSDRGGGARDELTYIEDPWDPLELCGGDCDSDYDCAPGLVCYDRLPHLTYWGYDLYTVPGCRGDADWSVDYCVDWRYSQSFDRLTFVGHGAPLGKCGGDCDRDEDCMFGLRCYQRNDFDPVPGCPGSGDRNVDYCYDVADEYVVPPEPESEPEPEPAVVVPSGGSTTLTVADESLVEGGSYYLGECVGDCDDDADCLPGLVCYHRRPHLVDFGRIGSEDAAKYVPGCGGDAQSNVDYCVQGMYAQSHDELTVFDHGGPYGRCAGPCGTDGDCLPGLVCFVREGPGPVPGCPGKEEKDVNYCVDAPTPDPTQGPTTPEAVIAAATERPSPEPTRMPSPAPTDAPATAPEPVPDPTPVPTAGPPPTSAPTPAPSLATISADGTDTTTTAPPPQAADPVPDPTQQPPAPPTAGSTGDAPSPSQAGPASPAADPTPTPGVPTEGGPADDAQAAAAPTSSQTPDDDGVDSFALNLSVAVQGDPNNAAVTSRSIGGPNLYSEVEGVLVRALENIIEDGLGYDVLGSDGAERRRRLMMMQPPSELSDGEEEDGMGRRRRRGLATLRHDPGASSISVVETQVQDTPIEWLTYAIGYDIVDFTDPTSTRRLGEINDWRRGVQESSKVSGTEIGDAVRGVVTDRIDDGTLIRRLREYDGRILGVADVGEESEAAISDAGGGSSSVASSTKGGEEGQADDPPRTGGLQPYSYALIALAACAFVLIVAMTVRFRRQGQRDEVPIGGFPQQQKEVLAIGELPTDDDDEESDAESPKWGDGSTLDALTTHFESKNAVIVPAAEDNSLSLSRSGLSTDSFGADQPAALPYDSALYRRYPGLFYPEVENNTIEF